MIGPDGHGWTSAAGRTFYGSRLSALDHARLCAGSLENHNDHFPNTDELHETGRRDLKEAGLDPDTDEAWRLAGIADGLAGLEKLLIRGWLREGRERVGKSRRPDGGFDEEAVAALTAELTKKIMAFRSPVAGEVAAEAVPAPAILAVGDVMPDGTIYAGTSPHTGKAMYATPRDASGVYDFNEAAQYAKKLDAHGHKDWRVPTKGELNVLYENRNRGKLKGAFNETGSDPARWYWSSSRNYGLDAWAQRFSDGLQLNSRSNGSSLRCVR